MPLTVALPRGSGDAAARGADRLAGALADDAALQPGEQVPVQGGASGVGIFAVQLAAILGGHVTATGRSADSGFVRDLGADRFVSADAGHPSQAAGGFDVVIDTVGGAVLGWRRWATR